MKLLPSFILGAICISVALPLHSQTRIVDGDTIVHNRERVRIWGLDCPEYPTPEGLRAGAELRKLIEGNRIILEPHATHATSSREKCQANMHKCLRPGHCDCYGRTVAQVYVQRITRAEFFTLDAACYMIQRGFCREYTYFSKGYYNRCKP